MNYFQNMKIGTKIVTCFILLIFASAFLVYLFNGIFDSLAVSIGAVVLVNALLTGIFWLFISGAVVKPLQEAQSVLGKMSLNDYTLEMTGNYSGTMKELSSNINGVRSRLLSVQDALVKVSKGDFSRLEEFEKIGKRSENDSMMPAVAGMMRTVLDIIDELDSLNKAAAEGNLSVRGDLNKFSGDYGRIIEGFNKTLDSIVEPLNSSIKIMENFSANDFTKNMNSDYKGAFSTFAKAINDVRARFITVQNLCNSVANGDTSGLEGLKKIGRRSENDHLIPSFVGMMEAIQNLYKEVEMLTHAIIAGELDVRGDAGKFEGSYKQIVLGLNNLIDASTAPVEEAKTVLGKMGMNDYTLEMKGKYNGMLNDLAVNINNVRTRLLSVQDAFVRVSKGDTSRLDEFRSVGKRSENDKLMPACTAMMQAIHDLMGETDLLANAALNGDLSVRGNLSKFEGGYRNIIEGINRTMDAVVRPIQEASNVMQKMSQGDLTITMEGDYKGDYARIKESLNYTVQSFNEVLNDINNASQQVATGARQVSDSAQALSQGSTEQASSIEELTASIEEIASQTNRNAENANTASKLGLEAKDDAVKGNERMKEMLKAMNDINEASGNISKIIKVIDEIAFQTNILALNAAVEAARAGQHGKGFAVVAEEVRNLAARSANAAKETTVLIEGSVKKSDDGTKIANETATALSEIVEGVAKAAELVGKIAEASDEQALGIAQINQGIMQVSQVVQNNSATSEESAAASEELSGQADHLKEQVGRFKLKKNSLHKRLDEINPDVLHALEGINKQRGIGSAAETDSSKHKKIILSDNEFGKY